MASRNLLKNYILKVIKLLLSHNKVSKDIKQQVEDIVNFEVALSLKCQRPDLAKISYMTLKQADQKASIGVTWGPWVDFFNDFFVSSINRQTPLLTQDRKAWFQVSYLDGLRDMLTPFFEVFQPSSVGDELYNDEIMANRARFFNTMSNYLTWCALRPYIAYASRPFRKAHGELVKGLLGGKAIDQR